MRLIDKDDLMRMVHKNPASNHAMRCVQLLNAILCAPPIADAVEVVRCKDCVKRKTDKCPMYHEEFEAFDSYDGSWIGYDKTTNNGFCQCGKKWR